MTGGHGDTVAIVMFRCSCHGKTRLRRDLPDAFCSALAEAMFHDVVTALGASDVTATVGLIHDRCGIPAVRNAGVEWLIEPSDTSGLNGAVAWACASLPAERVLVLPADLPLLKPEDVNALLKFDEDVIVAPTFDGGTGGLLLRPPTAIRPSFGTDSARRHLGEAFAAGLAGATYWSSGFDVDVDDVSSLAGAIEAGPGQHTLDLLYSIAGIGHWLSMDGWGGSFRRQRRGGAGIDVALSERWEAGAVFHPAETAT